jgi:hypothetical protein
MGERGVREQIEGRLPSINMTPSGGWQTGGYTLLMSIVRTVRELFRRARRVEPIGQRLNQVRGSSGSDVERSIEEFQHLSWRGYSKDWRFDREEVHQR